MAASNIQSSNTASSPLKAQHAMADSVCRNCLPLLSDYSSDKEIHTQKTFSPEFTVQQNVDSFRKVMQAQFDRKERERQSLASDLPGRNDLFDKSESVDPVVQIVLDNQYEDFGFPIYRVNYDDEGKWATWYEQFENLLETSLEEASGGEKIKERLILYKVEDSELNHLPFQAVQE
jgi:hypothetical protein